MCRGWILTGKINPRPLQILRGFFIYSGMLKYANTQIGFQEFPGETTLLINITGCPCHCEGCHSAYLAEDKGEKLTFEVLNKMINDNLGAITCVGIMGGDCNHDDVEKVARFINDMNSIKSNPRHIVKIGWYSGRDDVSDVDFSFFDYIKTGHYDKEVGPLSSPTTNQRMLKLTRRFVSDGWTHHYEVVRKEDITHMFQVKK